MSVVATTGVVCLTGVGAGGRVTVEAAGLATEPVMEHDVVVGSVDADRGHDEAAARALGDADRDWLGRLRTRRVPLDDAGAALAPKKHDVKVVVALQRPVGERSS